MTHLLCGTVPFSYTLFENPTKSLESINLSIPLPGHQLNLIKKKVSKEEDFIPSNLVPKEVNEKFSKVFQLPSNSVYRKKLAKEIFDLNHRSICKTEEFHSKPNVDSCICKFCNYSMNWYHKCLWYLWQIVANKLRLRLKWNFYDIFKFQFNFTFKMEQIQCAVRLQCALF